MTYQPCTAVLTDGNGRYLGIVVCDCDDGGPHWEPDYDNCPVHSRVQLKDSVEGVLQPQGERRADVSGSPPPRPTGTAPSAALPRRKW